MSAFLHALLQLALCRMTAAVVAAVLVVSPMPGGAPAAMLTLEDGPNRVAFDTQALLARPDAAEVEVPVDVGYRGGPRRYRAVPLAAR